MDFTEVGLMPAVKSGRTVDKMRKVLAIKYTPKPVMSQDNMTAPTEAPAAIFCGKEYMPPPIIELTTIAAKAKTPSPEFLVA